MSYSSNPLLPKARADAVRLLVEQQLPVAVAARKSGIHRTTLWRWHQQWEVLNEHVQLTNDNRPDRRAGQHTVSQFRLAACSWRIPTRSSRPHTFGHSVLPEVIERIQYYRSRYKRCAEIVHAHCLREGTSVSLSTVRRVLRRLGLVANTRYHKKYRAPVPRPVADAPGRLVQTDTVHLTSPFRKQKRVYLYTAIDVYSRWAYAEYHPKISQELSVQFLARAEASAGFHYQCVQADNGAEFGRYFEDCLKARNTLVRHSRVRRPNDNAFIERFNRTIQEECVGTTNPFSEELYGTVLAYLAYYNEKRLHLGLQCRTPAEMLRRC
jgi:transposase InsO family protein